VQKLISIAALVERLGRKEQELKSAGGYAQADGVRLSIITALKLADELPPESPPIDPSE
jgi:cell division protein ZapA (FtsZ GTPase activity inhibitor)